MSRVLRILTFPVDFVVTCVLWIYFAFGYCMLYLPLIAALYPFVRRRDLLLQKTNHYFYRGFFLIVRLMVPGLTIQIDDEVRAIHSSIIVSNHRSYLDPLLFMSIFPMHRTIVKGVFFSVPVMGWVLRTSGFMPYTDGRPVDRRMINGVAEIPEFLGEGGIVFIFPEGKRSRDGTMGRFHKGAFSIAARHCVPVEVLYITNTDRLFRPGRFFFKTCIKNTITIVRLGRIEPCCCGPREMRDRAQQMYRARSDADQF